MTSKKFHSILTSCLLAFSVAAFSGCSDDETAPDPTLTVEPKTLNFDLNGETLDVTVTTNQGDWGYELVETSESQSRCTVVKGTEGLKVTMTPGDGTAYSATIVIKAGTLTENVAVKQGAAMLTVDPAGLEFGEQGGSKPVAVTTNLSGWDYEITQPEGSDKEACSVEKTETGMNVSMTANDGAARTAKVTVRAASLVQTIEIAQDAAVPVFRFALPDFTEAKGSEGVKSLIVRVTDKAGRTVAEICNELIPQFSTKNRATVVYPADADGKRQLDRGLVTDNGGQVVWNAEDGTCTYTEGTGTPAEFYFVRGGEIVAETEKYEEAALADELMTDADGNTYPLVKAGFGDWMRGNLVSTTYRDGSPIATNLDADAWKSDKSGACCVYGYEDAKSTESTAENYRKKYGLLYNWAAATAAAGIAPEGFRLPTHDEWNAYYEFVGKKLMDAAGSTYMTRSGMTAAFGGARDLKGAFVDRGDYGYWWSSTAHSEAGHAWHGMLGYGFDEETYDEIYYFTPGGYAPKAEGYSVRLIRD